MCLYKVICTGQQNYLRKVTDYRCLPETNIVPVKIRTTLSDRIFWCNNKKGKKHVVVRPTDFPFRSESEIINHENL